VTVWADVFLGIIAVATLATAVIQIAVIVIAGRAMRQVSDAVDRFEQDIRPLIGHATAIGRDAARAAALATAQVERADRMFGDFAVRIEQTLASVQESIGGPAREARAIMAGLRATLQALGEVRRSPRGRAGRSEEEDALFI
jgi:hypothetical protein